MGASLFLFVNVPQFGFVLLFLAVVGAASNACMVATNTLLQTISHSRLRGRVMSVYMMVWGLMPLGTLPAGALADRVGVPFVVSVGGGLLAAIYLCTGLLSRGTRRLD
jgi:hypothetical protein